MSKCRTLGACNSGSSRYKTNINGNQGGGSKKQGLPPLTNKNIVLSNAINRKSYGMNRDYVTYVNQLGGIGRGKSQSLFGRGGVHSNEEEVIKTNLKIIKSYLNNIYEDYEVILVGENESLENDLSSCHCIDISNDHFIILKDASSNEYNNLPSYIKNKVNYVNSVVSDPSLIWNETYNGGVCDCGDNIGNTLSLGNHYIGLLPMRNDNDKRIKNELLELGYGNIIISDTNIRIFRWWTSIAAAALIIGGTATGNGELVVAGVSVATTGSAA